MECRKNKRVRVYINYRKRFYVVNIIFVTQVTFRKTDREVWKGRRKSWNCVRNDGTKRDKT
jgi:hypothetical protein